MPVLLTIPIRIPSGNTELRSHWAVRRRSMTRWMWAIRQQVKPRAKAAAVRMRVRITSYRERMLDPDNLVSGCKSLIDALKRSGLIYDDSGDWIDLDVSQEKAPVRRERTVVEIEEVGA